MCGRSKALQGSPPRVWGYLTGLSPTSAGAGSPPRVWGYQRRTCGAAATCRFTPTRVGISVSVTVTSPGSEVHPHACGDIFVAVFQFSGVGGSPPRVWGYRGEYLINRRSYRFTPTRVGISYNWTARYHLRSVHPHACGDIGSPFLLFVSLLGSPPRVWGYRAFRPFSQSGPPVHPHACGDIVLFLIGGIIAAGSPPRVWGYHPVTALPENP